MTRLFRGMKENASGLPEVGESARTLGIRPAIDVPASRIDEFVHAEDGGLSVSPDDPLNLPQHRRPPEFHGVGRDPVWVIDDTALGDDLCYRPDPDRANHGFVAPVRTMTLEEYQRALAQTQGRWQKKQP